MKEEIKKIIEETGLPIVRDEKSGTAQWVDLRELRLSYEISVENIKPFTRG